MRAIRPYQTVVDYLLNLNGADPIYYSRHIKSAKILLELVDGNTDEACAAISRTCEWLTGFGDKNDLRIETVIRKYFELKE